MARPHSTKPRSDFAHRLIQVREAFGIRTGRPGLDQKEFADILIKGHEAYRRYERGETEPDLSTLVKIRHLTGVPLDWLIAGIEERPRRTKSPTLRLLRKNTNR